jgi:hypothetical protein
MAERRVFIESGAVVVDEEAEGVLEGVAEDEVGWVENNCCKLAKIRLLTSSSASVSTVFGLRYKTMEIRATKSDSADANLCIYTGSQRSFSTTTAGREAVHNLRSGNDADVK